MKHPIIEISKKKGKSGRTPVTMILHEIHKDESHYNKNGITWVKSYCEQNLESIKGMPLVAQFLDDKHEVPFGSGHGNMIVEENKVVFEDSLVVGSFETGEIVEGLEVNGKTIDAVIGKGYVYNQRFPKLVEYLQEEHDNQNSVEGSVEICADQSKGNTKIVYNGGWKEKGRKPEIFDYSGHALIIGDTPADDSALLIELNSYKKKEGENKNMSIIAKSKSIEINKLSYDDIATLITRAFNNAMGVTGYYSDYYIYRFYPVDSQVVFKKWDDVGNYYMTTYGVENSTVTIGDITKVEEDWKPISDSVPVEINAEEIKQIIINKKGGSDLKTIEELTTKVTELSTQLAELNVKTTELDSVNAEKDAKIAELNEALVTASKSLEEANAKCSTLEVECNEYKEEKAKVELENKKAEVNAYYEVEIPKNHFEEAEVNSLKEHVEKCDLEGLKKAEAELIVKRFKEGKLNNVEVNSKKEENIFFHTKEEKVDDIEAGKSLFS